MITALAGCGGSSSNSLQTRVGFVYAVGQKSNTIFTFNQQADGELTASPLFTTATIPRPVAMTLNPAQNLLYVANLTSNAVSGFTVDHATGVIAPVGAALSPTQVGTSPVAVGIDPSGQFLYVLNQGSASISIFTIDAKGLLTAAGSATTPANPQSLVVSASSGLLYVAAGPVISGFSIGANGALTSTAGGFTGGTGVNVVQMTIDSKGQFLYAADSGGNAVLSFSIDANGALTPVAGSPFPAGTQPVSLALDRHDQFLYTANEASGDISAYSISSGALTQVTGSPFSSLPAGSTATAQPVFVTVDPSNLFVYVGNQSSNTISGLNLNPADGTLTQIVNSPFGGVGASWLIAIR